MVIRTRWRRQLPTTKATRSMGGVAHALRLKQDLQRALQPSRLAVAPLACKLLKASWEMREAERARAQQSSDNM